ncbi:hypothetical protein OG21DRAFT_1527852, partial [Imleria badia]
PSQQFSFKVASQTDNPTNSSLPGKTQISALQDHQDATSARKSATASGPLSRQSTPLDHGPGDEDHCPLPSHPVQLRQTHSFIKLPSSLPRSHSITAIEDEERDSGEQGIIDEVSLSEDNRFAEAVVHGQSEVKQTAQSSHTGSHANSAVGNLKPSQPPPTVVSSTIPDNSTHCQTSAAAHTSATHTGPSQPSQPPLTVVSAPSYPSAVHDIIERAKQFSHCDLASVNSFPLRPQFNDKAIKYMNEAITKRQDHGLIIPDGDIMKLLWEDIGNWCSSLKKKAHAYTHDWNEWDPENHHPCNAIIARQFLD